MNELDAHYLKLSDIRRTWKEDHVHDDLGRFTLYVAICSCGHRFEGHDTGTVTRSWVDHVERVEGA